MYNMNVKGGLLFGGWEAVQWEREGEGNERVNMMEIHYALYETH
jgi:hypothetical protein